MITRVIIIIFLLVSFVGMGQSIEKFSIDSGGASVLVGDVRMLYTIGEVNVQEFSFGGLQVSEGFINPTGAVEPGSLFITKWVVLAGETITIPTTESGYNYNVDWSYDALDGFNAESMNVTGDATSTVLTAGEHIVAISGDFPRIFFADSGDKDKITEIVQWGTNPWTSMLRAFEGCSNLNIINPAVGVPDLSSVTIARRMFYKAISFNSDIANWDVSNIIDMTAMFRRAYAFDQDLGAWDIGNVTNMEIMLFESVLSTSNYDNTLNGWATDSSGIPDDGIDDIPTNIIFNAGTSMYCAGEPSRNLLMNSLPIPTGYGWTITDGGLDCGGSESLFITKWVVNAGETITIPTRGEGYLYNVDWSYNAIDGFIADSSNVTGDATSPVLTAGEHIVAVSGDFPRIYFNDSGDKDKITEIVQWGTNPWASMQKAFAGCSNLNITNPAVGVPNLSFVTNMAGMFDKASSFNGAIGDWDVSNATNMMVMFRQAVAFNQNLDAWNVGMVTSMKRMFYQAAAFDQNLGAWDIGNVTTMEGMFFNATLSTTNYDATLIGWAADSSGTPDDGTDDIPTNITFNAGTSRYCAGEAARSLLMSSSPEGYNWTITDSGLDCGGSESLFITKWVVNAGETITIPTTGSGYNYTVDWSYDVIDGFNAESMNVTVDATSPVLTAGEHIVAITGDFPRIYFKNSGDKDKITEIVQWGTNPWLSMVEAFEGCSNLNITNPDAGAPNLSSVTKMVRMFTDASSFNGDIGNWDVSNVENMFFIFARCSSFNQDLSNWDTSNVTNMRRMFYDAGAFDQNLGAWDIGNVTTMEGMFFNATLSTTNYDATLIGWAADSSGTPDDGMDDIPTNITFSAGESRYCAGETARNLLTAALPAPTGYGWTVTDGGLGCPPPGLLGVNYSSLDSVSLYPNPTQSRVTIVSTQAIVTSATVYDIGGRKVSEVDFRNQSELEIDLSDFEAAVYLINIETENGTVNKRVVKME